MSYLDDAEARAARLREEAEDDGHVSYSAAMFGADALDHLAAFARAVLTICDNDNGYDAVWTVERIRDAAAEHLGEQP